MEKGKKGIERLGPATMAEGRGRNKSGIGGKEMEEGQRKLRLTAERNNSSEVELDKMNKGGKEVLGSKPKKEVKF